MPVNQPTAWYFLGECHLSLGDTEAARDAFARAVEPEIDTYHARLAAQRLNELPGEIPRR